MESLANIHKVGLRQKEMRKGDLRTFRGVDLEAPEAEQKEKCRFSTSIGCEFEERVELQYSFYKYDKPHGL